MIRTANANDVPAIVRMSERLRASIQSPLEVDASVVGRFVAGLLSSPLSAVWVVDAGADGPTGFLAASVGTASVSMAPIAVEHGWWAERGGGLLLLRSYLSWAKDVGCFAARMSTPPNNDRAAEILARLDFAVAEQAWVKVL